MFKTPFFAGKFYPSNFNLLDKEIKDSFLSEKGPGELVGNRSLRKLHAAIVPHSKYSFSGSCASWVYKEIGESKFPETFVILGTDHKKEKEGFSTSLFLDWETPLGIVKLDKSLGSQLFKKFPLENDYAAFSDDFSVEIQLPFLQFAKG